jgi:hypothetical protein
MKCYRQNIDINGYWKVIILYNVYLGELDTGFTYTDYSKRRSIVAISTSSSSEQFFNTLIHELKHLQSHICKYYNVKEDSEDAAYLIGYIAQNIYRFYKNL